VWAVLFGPEKDFGNPGEDDREIYRQAYYPEFDNTERNRSMEPSARFGPPFRALLLHHFVAFAARHFQLWAVDNIDVAALVRNQASFLKNSRSHRDAGTAGAQHMCQKFLGQGNEVRS
jgi:hypothetical protein